MSLHGLLKGFWGGRGLSSEDFEHYKKNLRLMAMEGGSGDDQDVSDPRKKKKYHRHTSRQIQQLEAMFKECPHPDEKQRLQLSRELDLEPRQIKFWFQNRRTQMKAQHERADNCALRAENDRIRCENIAIREALKNVICTSCGGPPLSEDMYFDEQKLRLENARLEEELDRMSSIAAKYIGRPISQLPPVQPVHLSSLDLTVGGFGSQSTPGPSLDLDLLSGSSLGSSFVSLPMQSGGVADFEKSFMVDAATGAMDEFIKMVQMEEPLWAKQVGLESERLNVDTYKQIFPHTSQLKVPDVRTEASRASGMVIINGLSLVDALLDGNKYVEMFSTIISQARTIDVLTPGIAGSRSGSLQLMYAELQVLSPLVSTRELYFLRYCQQHGPGTWAIVDVSIDSSKENQFNSPLQCRKLPSGCWIQDIPNGCSKITWIEHINVEDRGTHYGIYQDLIHSGLAFGAQRWLATLQRMCEWYAGLMVNSVPAREVGAIPSPEGRRSMMKLSQRMLKIFFASISASSSHRWTTLSGLNGDGVRIMTQKSTDPGQPNGVLLSAATSFWLPLSPQSVFDFFRDARNRPQWDVLSSGNTVQEVAHIVNGSHPGNCISLLRAFNASHNNMLILQENTTDASGSLVVYSPVDISAINIAMSGEDPSFVALLPSGFTISSDGHADHPSCGVGGNGETGSLVTVAIQIHGSSLPSAKLNLESVNTVNNLIGTTVQHIKAALNCTGV